MIKKEKSTGGKMFDKRGTWVWVELSVFDTFPKLVCLETGAVIMTHSLGDGSKGMIVWRSHQVSERGPRNDIDFDREVRRVKICDYESKDEAQAILENFIKITKAKPARPK